MKIYIAGLTTPFPHIFQSYEKEGYPLLPPFFFMTLVEKVTFIQCSNPCGRQGGGCGGSMCKILKIANILLLCTNMYACRRDTENNKNENTKYKKRIAVKQGGGWNKNIFRL